MNRRQKKKQLKKQTGVTPEQYACAAEIMLKTLGFATIAAAEMSTKLTELAKDVAIFQKNERR